MSHEEIDEYIENNQFADWKGENISTLIQDFLEEKESEFEAFCKKAYKERGE